MANTLDIKDLGLEIDGNIFGIMDDETEFLPAAGQFDLRLGVKTPFIGTLNGKVFECEATLQSAELGRLALMTHEVNRNGEKHDSNIITGTFRNVRIDIDIKIDGSWHSLPDLLFSVVNGGRAKHGQEPIDKATFVRTLMGMGMPLIPVQEYGVSGGMTMVWQHFAANPEVIEQAFDLLARNGATPGRTVNRIVRALELPRSEQGLPVSLIEVGRQDRTKSRSWNKDLILENNQTVTYGGDGFQDLLDAVYSNFERALTLRATRRAVEAEAAKIDIKTKDGSEKLKALNEQAELLNQMSRSWISNWGGASRRVVPQPDGTLLYGDVVDPVQVPCGHFKVQDVASTTTDGDEVKEAWEDLSFWVTNNDKTNTAATAVVDTTEAGTLADEPF